MMNEKLLDYLYEKIPKRSPLFEEMEQYAKEEHVPIMDPYSMETLLLLLQLYKPKAILEIGAAIGYSALRMASRTDAKIVTVERDEKRISDAKKFINQANKADQIVLLEGDAFDLVDQVAAYAPFDCMFIDAAKGQYQRFFEAFEPYMAESHVIITDNVLFRGFVYNGQYENKRLANLAKKIDQYNHWLITNQAYQTVILPVGDGMAISIKK
ncbi:O-methyltransferase [Caldibacillus lycopersici]|uniref:tRNA 5-hydroxyuridine methyltransferase n=1 Tax=Perspicuibacillus lycopersici TaxID=1325689 RepID=A0AAE3IW54_9BACI|nr:O-methyltransferase [Perspicuibacillus lycopersici]MCU9613964.1 O-methyltransferase [Perspicuibacillus lycopersici]